MLNVLCNVPRTLNPDGHSHTHKKSSQSQYSWVKRRLGNKWTFQHTRTQDYRVSCDMWLPLCVCVHECACLCVCVFCLFSSVWLRHLIYGTVSLAYSMCWLGGHVSVWLRHTTGLKISKQWGEPVVWDMSGLFLRQFTKRVINIDKSSGERDSWREREREREGGSSPLFELVAKDLRRKLCVCARARLQVWVDRGECWLKN